jgi:hypothetical protein
LKFGRFGFSPGPVTPINWVRGPNEERKEHDMLLIGLLALGLLWAFTALTVVALCMAAAQGDAAQRSVHDAPQPRGRFARGHMRLVA